MRIRLILNGKTEEPWVATGTEKYLKRLKHYVPTEVVVLPALRNAKNLNAKQVCQKEGELLLQKIQNSDHLVLLDENGKERSSEGLSNWMQQHLNSGKKQLVLVVGGPYGFSEEVYRRANEKLSLSQMTFSHQMVRPFLAEQLYRAFTILRKEPYHHR